MTRMKVLRGGKGQREKEVPVGAEEAAEDRVASCAVPCTARDHHCEPLWPGSP